MELFKSRTRVAYTNAVGDKVYPVIVDIKRGIKSTEDIQFVSSDIRTGVISVALMHNNAPYNVYGCKVLCTVLRPDASMFEVECECIQDNIIEVELGAVGTRLDGIYSFDIKIQLSETKTVGTPQMSYSVAQSLDMDDFIMEDDRVPILTSLITQTEEAVDVNSNGLITAKGVGYSKVTATTDDGGHKYDIRVTVAASSGGGSGSATTSGIKVAPESVSIERGKTVDVTISFGSDAINKNIECMSSNGAIASVSDLGSYKYRITGVGQGSTSIRFRTSDGKFETSCSVTVTSGSASGDSTINEEYTQSCTSEYILDKMYPMGQSHEAIPSGLITDTWKYNSRWENQYRPTAVAHSCGQSGCPGTGAFQALGCWSNIYRVEGTPFSQNTGVEMKDIKVYGWYNGAWELVQHLPVPNGNFYAESFSGDSNRYFGDSVKQSSTSKTIILREKNKIDAMNWNTGQLQSENCMYHPFSDVKNFDTKYEYIYTCIDLRKVKWDENGVDDRDQTHYCSNCGGDWWLKEGLMFHDSWQHNKGVCQPKMVEITNEWRRFSMTTVPQSWSNGFPK